MNRIVPIALAAIVVLAGFFYWSQVAGASIGNLNIYEGTVDMVRGNSTVAGKTGNETHKNDVIKTGPGSRVSIILKDGSVIRLEAESEVRIVNMTSFHLVKGKMWSKVKPLQSDTSWQVETPTIVASVRGTEFNTRYNNKSSGVSVYEGSVGVALLSKRGDEKLLVKDNQFILGDETLDRDFVKGPIIMDGNQDDWTIFNLTEDAKLENKVFVPKVEEQKPVPKAETKPTTTTRIVPKEVPVETKTPVKVLQRIVISYIKDQPITQEGQYYTYYNPQYPNPKVQLAATAFYDSGKEDITLLCDWSVTGSAGGSIDPNGLYTPETKGDAVIEANYDGVQAMVTISIP